MRLATWNVNSIRTRVDRVTDWLERADVDVLAMQETKCTDDAVPDDAVRRPRIRGRALSGSTSGTAWRSRRASASTTSRSASTGQPTWSDKPDVEAAAEARALGATCGGVRVWSLYMPNGRTVDDPHYGYKLDWLAALRDTAHGWLTDDPRRTIALVGDWNIAPTDEDVWDMSSSRAARTSSGPERAAFNAIVDAQFADVVRPFTPGPRYLHLLGLHPAARSRRAAACASTSSSAHRHWPRGSATPRSSRTNAGPARRAPLRPAITRRSWWS